MISNKAVNCKVQEGIMKKIFNIPHMEIQCLLKMQQKWELKNKFSFKKVIIYKRNS